MNYLLSCGAYFHVNVLTHFVFNREFEAAYSLE